MKKALSVILLLLLLFCLAGCAEEASVAGRYRYEGEGFPDAFSLILHEDGTFFYYEGMLSSYIGTGYWTLSEDVLTLTEETRVNRFRFEEGQLSFLAEGSDNFLYIQLADGERFLPLPPEKGD